ncbi:MAG: hypothetical protein D6724_07705 [Armatimonadetes bacterium]|nr:MAG: hypothetical protein D6724_07705 [Armatimonadota bacterium]
MNIVVGGGLCVAVRQDVKTQTAGVLRANIRLVPAHEAFDSWLEALLRVVKPPYWLTGDAPWRDVVLSSRVRIARSVEGFAFPHRERSDALIALARRVRSTLAWEVREQLSEAEKAILVGSRLVSHDFRWGDPGRLLLLNEDRSASVLVNEEDHLRIQAVTPGLSPQYGETLALQVERTLGEELPFAESPEMGFLTACPTNCGSGRRIGAMLHIAGLSARGWIHGIVAQLRQDGYEVRGPLGEGTPGWGAFAQISSLRRNTLELYGVIRGLIDQEYQARASLGQDFIRYRVDLTYDEIRTAESLTAAQAIRLLGWLRLGAVTGALDLPVQALDATTSLVWIGPSEPAWNVRRARLLRELDRFASVWTGRTPTMRTRGEGHVR